MLQKALAVATSFMMLLTAVCLMAHTARGTIAVMNVGSWQAPFGITLAVDMLSSVMLVLAGLLAVAVSVYSCFDLDGPRIKLAFSR